MTESRTRAYRCIGGPLHGQTIHTDQYDYVAVVPKPSRTFDPRGSLLPDAASGVETIRYRVERFGGRSHAATLFVMVADGVSKNGIEVLRMMLDAFMPEMLAAHD
jgi:hypothetical protein